MIKATVLMTIVAVFTITVLGLGFAPQTLAATAADDLCAGSGGGWSGSSCSNAADRVGGVDGLIGTIVDALLFLTAAVSVIMIIIGGLRYTTSGGDQNAVKNAKNTIMYALIGLAVSLLAFALVKTVFAELL